MGSFWETYARDIPEKYFRAHQPARRDMYTVIWDFLMMARTSASLFYSEADLLAVAEDAVRHAGKLGADDASVLANEVAGTTIRVRDRKPVSSVKDGMLSLGITVYFGGACGFASTQATDPESVRNTVAQACAIAREVQADPDNALADPAWLATDVRDVPLFAPSQKTPADLTAAALDLEAAALSLGAESPVGLRVEEAHVASADMRWARVMSNGFSGSASASIQARTCVAIAGEGEGMARAWCSVARRRESDLPGTDDIAGEAVRRAQAKLGARGLTTQDAPVLFDARIAATLVSDLVAALSGTVQQQQASFLTDSIGQQVLPAHVDLLEDPYEPFGLASFGWDSDGVAATRRHVVSEGTIAGYFLNVRTARKLGLKSTGNADGPANLILTSRHCHVGDDTAAMLRKMHRGLWVTQLIGGRANIATGGWSKAAEGFWVENGEIAYPVHDITVAGDLSTMLQGIVSVGADSCCQGAVRTGSILIDGMRIAGR